MILQCLRDLALREGLLQNPDYEPKPVAWIITVGEGGRFVCLTPTVSEQGPKKKPQPKTMQIPRRTGRTSGALADFLVDKSEYVLGIEPDGKRVAQDLRVRRGLFLASAQQAAESAPEEISAVCSFLANDAERERCSEELTRAGYKSNDLLAFEYHDQLVHELPEIQSYFSRSRAGSSTSASQCLICGQANEAVEKHPTVRIPGGSTSGVALVSFNSDAFESYGWSRNENAPVCRTCADAYTTALNRLLSDRYPDPHRLAQTLPRRFVRLAPDTTAIFWTDGNPETVDLFANLFDRPDPEAVSALFSAPQKGRAPVALPPRFYCLILSGGQGRATLRGMHTGMLEPVEENIREYFRSIEIGGNSPLSLFALLRSIALLGKIENVPPSLAGDLFLAILFGRLFPRTVLAAAVQRCRAERRVPRERAALIRAYLNRNETTQEVDVSLDKSSNAAGYRLGRLLAILERIQGDVQRSLNKTIVDRYYGAASTRPASVFPRLIALAQHHIAKSNFARNQHARLGEVLDGLATFPPILTLEEQGLFALGYYHQRQDFFKKKAEPEAPSDSEPILEQEEQSGEFA